MSAIESRLAAVERQLRFHRAVIVGLLIALVALVGYGATEGVPEVIRARKFEVLNKAGKPVIVARAVLNAGALDIYNSEGAPVVTARAKHEGTRSKPVGGGGELSVFDFGKDSRGASTTLDGDGMRVGGEHTSGFSALLDDGLRVWNGQGSVVMEAAGGARGGVLAISDEDGQQAVTASAWGAGDDHWREGRGLRVYNYEGEPVFIARPRNGSMLTGAELALRDETGANILRAYKPRSGDARVFAETLFAGTLRIRDNQWKWHTLTPP